MDIAIEKSPILKASESALNVANVRKDIAYFDLFPKLSMNAGSEFASFNGVFNSANWGNNIGFQIDQPIFQTSRNWVHEQQADLRSQVAELEWKKARDKLCLDVADAYYDYTFAARRVTVQLDKDKLLKRQYQTRRKIFEDGRRTYRDVSRLEAQMQLAQIETESFKQKRDLKAIDLAKHLGFANANQLGTLDLWEGLDDVVLDKNQDEDLDPSKHFDYRIADIAKSANQLEVTLAKQAFLPDVNLSFRSGASNFLNLAPAQGNGGELTWSAGVTLRYDLFDFGQRNRKVTLARHETSQKNSLLDVTVLNAESDIESYKVDLRNQLLHWRLSKKLERIQASNFKAIQDDYRQGKVEYLDLVSSLDESINAKIGLLSSSIELQKLASRRLYLQGQLYETYH